MRSSSKAHGRRKASRAGQRARFGQCSVVGAPRRGRAQTTTTSPCVERPTSLKPPIPLAINYTRQSGRPPKVPPIDLERIATAPSSEQKRSLTRRLSERGLLRPKMKASLSDVQRPITSRECFIWIIDGHRIPLLHDLLDRGTRRLCTVRSCDCR